MKLSIGQKAPQFILKDIYGNSIQLQSFKGKKLLVSFFRDVSCPFCNLRIRDLSKKREQLEAQGLYMIFFFESTPDQLNNSPFHKKASPIPLIGDPEMTTYKKFGVEQSTTKLLKTFLQGGIMKAKKDTKDFNIPDKKEKHTTLNLIPADFLIDENLVIQKAYYGEHLRDHLPTSEIVSFAEKETAVF